MIAKIEDGDKIIFLKNVLKDGTYGDSIIKSDLFALRMSDNKFSTISDDINMKIFPYLNGLYWELKKSNHHAQNNLIRLTRYYSYVLLNGEYKIIFFGNTIKNFIIDYLKSHDDIEHEFLINIRIMSGFPNYENSYFTNTLSKDISEDFLKTKSMYIEDYIAKSKWTNSENSEKLYNFLKESNVDIPKIPKFQNYIREQKLKRILND